MDRTECKTITVYRQITVTLNPAWPKYQMVCGQLLRLKSEQDVIECLTIKKMWCPYEAEGQLSI